MNNLIDNMPPECKDRCYCEICDKGFLVDKYAGGDCPTCGQSYVYDEGYGIELTKDQIELLKCKECPSMHRGDND